MSRFIRRNIQYSPGVYFHVKTRMIRSIITVIATYDHCHLIFANGEWDWPIGKRKIPSVNRVAYAEKLSWLFLSYEKLPKRVLLTLNFHLRFCQSLIRLILSRGGLSLNEESNVCQTPLKIDSIDHFFRVYNIKK